MVDLIQLFVIQSKTKVFSLGFETVDLRIRVLNASIVGWNSTVSLCSYRSIIYTGDRAF